MGNNYRTPLKPSLIVAGIYALWAIGAPTSMGTGGYIIWTPIVAIAAYVVHNMIRWVTK